LEEAKVHLSVVIPEEVEKISMLDSTARIPNYTTRGHKYLLPVTVSLLLRMFR